MALVGYARVSTDEQTTDAQMDALKLAGCKSIHREQASGASRARPELKLALERCKRGDVLVVVRIDRLARSLSHLMEIIETLDARGAGFRSLGDPIDTTSPQGRFALQILGAVAEFERALIRERTKAGLQAARERGRVGGNPALRLGLAKEARAVHAARDARRSADLHRVSGQIIPAIQAMRPGYSWKTVASSLDRKGQGVLTEDLGLGRPWRGPPAVWRATASLRVTPWNERPAGVTATTSSPLSRWL